MVYWHRVYGKIKIEEPVILDLIKLPELRRLKYVDQGGYKPLWVKPKTLLKNFDDHSRFVHSLGVYWLLKKYGAPIEEQVAGLIHDVSHSAFSHCVDYILKGGSQKTHSHQDDNHENFVKKTKIPAVLKKYDFDLDYILEDENFPLKEKSLPDLCADRIDYSLQTAVIFGEIFQQQARYFLDNLLVQNQRWVFKNFKSAKKYADLFYRLNKVYYSGLCSAIMFRAVGDCVGYALKRRYLVFDDLYTNDKKVIFKIKNKVKEDKKLALFFERMNGRIVCRDNPSDFEARVFCKSRLVDPLCVARGIIKRVSEIEPNWAGTIKRELKPKEYFLKFVK